MAHAWTVSTLLLLITWTAKESHGSKSNKSTLVELLEHLMDGYNKGVRPVKNWRQPTTVYIEISIYTILGVDEKNQLVKTYIWYNQSWVDEFLLWDPIQFDNVTYISIPTQSIWLPDIMIEEAVGPRESSDVPYVYVNSRGRVFNNNPIRLMTSCNLNIYFFPFDVLNCSLSFSSWLHTTHDINISFWRTTEDLTLLKNPSVTEGEWDLTHVLPSYTEFTDNDGKYGKITFYIVLKRKPLFYTVNLILPSVLLMIMDMVGFYLPPESGERISFKITLLLGYSVFLIIVSDTLPATGAPLIGVYFVMCMLLLVISLTESILIVQLIHQRNLSPEVPKWLKRLVLEKMTILLCMRDKCQTGALCSKNSGISWQIENDSVGKLSDNKSEKPNDCLLAQVLLAQTQVLEVLNCIVKEVESIREDLKKTDDHDARKEWLQVGYVLDTFLFRAYLALCAYRQNVMGDDTNEKNISIMNKIGFMYSLMIAQLQNVFSLKNNMENQLEELKENRNWSGFKEMLTFIDTFITLQSDKPCISKIHKGKMTRRRLSRWAEGEAPTNRCQLVEWMPIQEEIEEAGYSSFSYTLEIKEWLIEE
ncbi:5-hydroxytryptamine receptor 3A-like [Pseudophryne corroboree]|uniref:5-hydroxytryptamine receptor 3A-like n=1 Tax=Pseudophryne corroboree TaxID=495146 RepID=UPI0030815555